MSRKYRTLVRNVFSTPWAILPEKMDAIAEVLEIRASGEEVSPDRVAASLNENRNRKAMPSSGGVGVLNVFGVLAQRMGMLEESSGGTSTEAASQAFAAMLNDKAVGSILLNIDSPGGSVFGIQEFADQIYQARGTKPIIAVVNSEAASGAYWVASAADEIVITPSGMAGSIGVLMMHSDTSQLDEKMGVKNTIIRMPEYKALGTGGEPLPEEEVAYRAGMVGQYYQSFVAAVARNRGTTPSAVMADYGKGRVLTAHDALSAGMVDRVGTYQSIVSELLNVGQAGRASAASGRVSKPAFSFEGKLSNMNPKLFGLLVRAGLCDITASEDEADRKLKAFLVAKDKEGADEATAIALLQDQVKPKPLPVATLESTVNPASEIMAAIKIATGIPDVRKMELADELIRSKCSLEVALNKIADEAAAAQVKPGATLDIRPVRASRDAFATEARCSILDRMLAGRPTERIWDFRQNDYVPFKPAARQNYRLQGLLTLAEECLVMDGYDRQDIQRLAGWQIAHLVMGAKPENFGLRMASDGPAYNTSGMFSNILLDAANVGLRMSYDNSRTTFQTWMKRGESLRDFKLTHRVIAGELSDPKAIPEDGEFEEATLSDAKEAYRLVVWGEVFSISWQAVVNDQLGAFTEVPMKQGQAMRRKQNKLAYNVLKDNPTMADTGALFNTTAVTTAGGHANLTEAAATPTVATLNTMTTKMAEQPGLVTTGGSALNLRPRYLITCPALMGTVLELLSSTANPAASGNSGINNIWRNGLEPVIDAELGTAYGGLDTTWYLACDPMECDTIEYAFLQGMETPRIDQEVAFDRLAMRQRIYQAFAVHPIDFRGLQKHKGAS